VKRIPTLDGWRGIAILMVLLDHAAFQSHLDQKLWAQQGRTGVDIFFVISGYIITARLLQEGDHIDLSAFYLRRAVRILPPVTVYLACIALFAWVGLLHDVTRSDLMGSLLFFRNYQMAAHPGGTYTGHFWSLAIEEHFYLLWPGLLVLLRPRRALYAAAIGAPLCALWRIHCYAVNPDAGKSLFFVAIRTDCRLDGLLIGCALALILRHDSARKWVRTNFPKETPLLCCFPILLILSRSQGLPSIWLYLLIVVALCSTLLVQEGLAYKWLNYPPLIWLGRISYGLYVYEGVFLIHSLHATHIPLLQRFPINLCASLAAAVASFYLLERPLMRLVRKSRPAPEITAIDEAPTPFTQMSPSEMLSGTEAH
jgi:peptidoglycan/LPS O-acetylase OafA/YrhL